MSSHQRKIFSNIIVFGSVQLLALAAGVLRSKLAAIWTGAEGVGLFSLLAGSIGIMTSLLNLGLPTALLTYLKPGSDNWPQKLRTARLLTVALGIIGAVLCLIFAAPLSTLTFGTPNYKWAFQLISGPVFCKLAAVGYVAIFQSSGEKKRMAKAMAQSTLLGLCFTVPLYYFLRLEGVVIAILAAALVELILFFFTYKKLRLREENAGLKKSLTDYKYLITNGIYYSISAFAGIAALYAVQIFISRKAGVEILGYFSAGNTLIVTYVSVLFTSLSYDFLPRLVKSGDNVEIMTREINGQIKAGIIILIPVLLLVILLCPVLLVILFSKSFTPATGYVILAAPGVFFRLLSFILASVMIAAADKKLYLTVEAVFAVIFIMISVAGYNTAALAGLGAAYSTYYLLYLLVVFYIAKKKFNIAMERNIILRCLLGSLAVTIFALLSFYLPRHKIIPIIGLLMVIFASLWSLTQFRKIHGFRNP